MTNVTCKGAPDSVRMEFPVLEEKMSLSRVESSCELRRYFTLSQSKFLADSL